MCHSKEQRLDTYMGDHTLDWAHTLLRHGASLGWEGNCHINIVTHNGISYNAMGYHTTHLYSSIWLCTLLGTFIILYLTACDFWVRRSLACANLDRLALSTRLCLCSRVRVSK